MPFENLISAASFFIHRVDNPKKVCRYIRHYQFVKEAFSPDSVKCFFEVNKSGKYFLFVGFKILNN